MFKFTHPHYGVLISENPEFYLGGGEKNVRYVGGYWGITRIYANLPVSECVAVRVTKR